MLLVKNKDARGVETLLAFSPDLEQQDAQGKTALILAVDNDDQNCTRLLLEYGAAVTYQAQKPEAQLISAFGRAHSQTGSPIYVLLENALDTVKEASINTHIRQKLPTAVSQIVEGYVFDGSGYSNFFSSRPCTSPVSAAAAQEIKEQKLETKRSDTDEEEPAAPSTGPTTA
jgi:hypothetical protein